MITKPYFLPDVMKWEIYFGGVRSEYTHRLYRDIRIFGKIGQRFTCGMQHLGETAQNGVFLGEHLLPSRQPESGFEGASSCIGNVNALSDTGGAGRSSGIGSVNTLSGNQQHAQVKR